MAYLTTCVAERPHGPHVAPVRYGYTDGVVEVLTAGRKLTNIRENPRVALSIGKNEGEKAEWTVTLGRATAIEDDEAN